MFPKLGPEQIARLEHFGKRRRFAAGDVIFERGEPKRGFYVLITGQIEVLSPAQEGETVVTLQRPGEFTGELDMLSGRRSLVRARSVGATEVVEIPLENLRRIVQTDAELSEIFLRAFLLRRSYLIAHSVSDLLLIGSSHSADTLRLRSFLTRNGQPHTISMWIAIPASRNCLTSSRFSPARFR